jgi:signal peptidase II
MAVGNNEKAVGCASRWFIFGIIAGLILVADQMTKQMVIESIPLNRGFGLLPGFVDLVHVRNPGAAFGIMSRADWDFRKLFFIVVSVAALTAIVMLFLTSRQLSWRLVIGYSLFFGGALGNLVDRIRFGEVIDFLDVHWGQYHWPAFNVADTALCVGVGLFAWHILMTREKEAH